MRKLIYAVLLTLLCLSSSVFAAWQDLADGKFSYSPRPAFDRINRQYSSIVTLTNAGEAIEGPIRVMVDSASHQILNADGDDGGIPFKLLDIDALEAGASHKFVLKLKLKRARVKLKLRLQVEQESTGTAIELAANQIALFYNREDGHYDGWGLHLWNGEGCGNYAAATTDNTHFGNWGNPYPADGVHPVYGAYYILTIEPGAKCYNFIVHKGNDKGLGDGNARFEPAQGQQAFTFHGYADIWYNPVASRPITLDGARAHWLDTGTLVWLTNNPQSSQYRLYSSIDANIHNIEPASLADTPYVEMSSAAPAQALLDRDPQLNGFAGFSLDMTESQAKAMVKSQLIAVALDDQGNMTDATRVQLPRVLDDLYTSADDDANEAHLGLSYADQNVTASVWAPTAQRVNLKVYNAAKQLINTHPMLEDSQTGIWHYTGKKSVLDRQFYRYEVKVFHPLTEKIEQLEATDPYSVSLATNGRYTQFVNLDDDDLKPAGWDGHAVPSQGDPEDSIIYESHIRDFSILDESTSPQNRGKYLAFTESNSVPVRHLQALQQAGLTHLHLLPANDIASIQEDQSRRVDLTDTVGKLCAVNASAPVCGVENNNATLLSVLQSYDPSTTDAQALVESMRGLDGFNWGYDPHHFAAPEGSYATDPDGIARVVEMRAMNQALHEMGLRVVLDVVYNHAASSGLYDNSVLDKLVPGYYHRLSEVTGRIENSTCCENTGTEYRMMSKLMSDSLVSFAEHFGFDSFRFDLMGHIPRQAVLDARNAVRQVDPDTYFYGEGWNFGEVANNRRFQQASQLNMAGTEVGTFSDRMRDAVRDGALFNRGGSIHEQDVVRIGLVGNVGSYHFVSAGGSYLSAKDYQWRGQPAGYSDDPADTVNYISKHDNEALWDKLQYNLPASMGIDDRVRVQQVALSFPILGQGVPFLHMGSELLRSKSMDRNTYDAGDWFNRVDFSMNKGNWNIGLPLAQDNQNNWSAISGVSANGNSAMSSGNIQYSAEIFKELLSIRRDSKLFRLATAEQVSQRIKFYNTGPKQQQGLIVMSLDDGIGLSDIDPENDAIVVLFNASTSDKSFYIGDAVGFSLHPNLQNSRDMRVRAASFNNGNFRVPALTTAVFVKAQQGDQGYGLSALPPYGDRDIYLRGGMNAWGTDMPLVYQGNNTYQGKFELKAGSYQFKLADAAFAKANIGGGFSVPLGSKVTLFNHGDNLSVDLPVSSKYTFTLKADSSKSPVLQISSDDPAAGTPPYGDAIVYVRGSMNGWGTSYPMKYQGNGIYRGVYQVASGSYSFKLAGANWHSPNLGGNLSLAPGDTVQLVPGSNDNMRLAISVTQDYIFVLDASNLSAPQLSISQK